VLSTLDGPFQNLFSADAQVLRCRTLVQNELKNNYGHGLDHVEKVAVEAGALLYLEAEKRSMGEAENSGRGFWSRWPAFSMIFVAEKKIMPGSGPRRPGKSSGIFPSLRKRKE